MIRQLPPLLRPALLALAACASLMAAGPDTPDKAAGGKDAKKGAAPADKPGAQQQAQQKAEDAAGGLGAFGKVLPLGQENKDAMMPSFKDGKLNSFVHASTMTRINDDTMVMKKVDIRLYGATEADDLRVQLLSGIYNMNSQVLDSHERSRVSRSDFQLEGDSMVFDTRSQQGKMVGNVHMIIYNAESMKNKPLVTPQAQEETTPQPQAAPKAKNKAKK